MIMKLSLSLSLSLSSLLMVMVPTTYAIRLTLTKNYDNNDNINNINNIHNNNNNAKLAIYNETEAYYFSAFAATSFCKTEGEIEKWDCWTCKRMGMSASIVNPILLNEGDIQALVATDTLNKRVIVTFRGSQTVTNYMRDASFKTVDITKGYYGDENTFPECENGRCGKIHKGLHSAYSDIREKVLKELDTRANTLADFPLYKIHVAGHSLGGAIAGFCSLDLIVNSKYKSQIGDTYTYGQPRLGNVEFAKYFDEKVTLFRVVNYRDIVPHLMFATAPWYYFHSGIEIFYKSNTYKPGNYNICPNADFGIYNNQTTSKSFDSLIASPNTPWHDLQFLSLVQEGKTRNIRGPSGSNCDVADQGCSNCLLHYNPIDHIKGYMGMTFFGCCSRGLCEWLG